MPAAGVVMIIAVLLIVLALVYYLVSTIVALQKITKAPRRGDRRRRRDHREERAGQRGGRPRSTRTSTPASTCSRACSSRRRAWRTRSAWSKACIPALRGRGVPQLPREQDDQGPADQRGVHEGHADAGPARPRGADRGGEPERARRCATRPTAAWPPAGSTRRSGRRGRQSMPRSPIIGTDSPVQYEPSESPGVRKRMPVAVGASRHRSAEDRRRRPVKSGLAFLRRLKSD